MTRALLVLSSAGWVLGLSFYSALTMWKGQQALCSSGHPVWWTIHH